MKALKKQTKVRNRTWLWLMLGVLMGCSSVGSDTVDAGEPAKGIEEEEVSIRILADLGGAPVAPVEAGATEPPLSKEQWAERERQELIEAKRELRERMSASSTPTGLALIYGIIAHKPDHWAGAGLEIKASEASGGELRSLVFSLYDPDGEEEREASEELRQLAVAHLEADPDAHPFVHALIEVVPLRDGRWQMKTVLLPPRQP